MKVRSEDKGYGSEENGGKRQEPQDNTTHSTLFLARTWESLCVHETTSFIRCHETKRSFESVKGALTGSGIHVPEILGVRVMEKGRILQSLRRTEFSG